MRRRALPVALLCVLALGCGSSSPVEPIPGPGDYVRTLQSGGLSRTYEVHVPAGVDPSVPAPLVLVFHGVPRGAGMRAITGSASEGCRAGSSVVLYRIEGGGHTWPGAPVDFPPSFGRRSDDLSASEAIADFFAAHP